MGVKVDGKVGGWVGGQIGGWVGGRVSGSNVVKVGTSVVGFFVVDLRPLHLIFCKRFVATLVSTIS